MVLAARRAYRDASRWMRAARPPGFDPARLARKVFSVSLLSGLAVMAALGLFSPTAFGRSGTSPLEMGWPALVLLSFLAAAGLVALFYLRGVVSFLERAREPFVRPLDRHYGYEGAAGALAACPAPFRYRFLLARLAGPGLLAIIAAVCAWSAAYFVVDATLSRFQVGWPHPVLGTANALLSIFLLRIAAPRLSTWRLALSVYKAVTSGY